MPRALSPFEQQFIFFPPRRYSKVKVPSLKCMLSQCNQQRAAGESHSLPVHVMKGVKKKKKKNEAPADMRVFVTRLPKRWIQWNKMEKVNIILADEGIFHDIYTQQGFSPWEHPHNTPLARIWAVAYALSVQNIKSASLFQEAHTPRELYTLPNWCNLLNFTPVAVRQCLCRDWWTKGSFRTWGGRSTSGCPMNLRW